MVICIEFCKARRDGRWRRGDSSTACLEKSRGKFWDYSRFEFGRTVVMAGDWEREPFLDSWDECCLL